MINKFKKSNFLFIFFFATFSILSSCIDGTANRRGNSSSSDNSVNPKATDGLNIASACLCKNGKLIDGPSSCGIVSCIDSTLSRNLNKNVTYATITLGKDIYSPIWQKNGKSFNPKEPLKSVCSLPSYRCVVNIDATYYSVDGNNAINPNPIEDNQEITISTTSLILNTPEKSIVEISGNLSGIRRPTNKLQFEIQYKDELSGDFKSLYSSNEVELNLYEGDGLLSPSQLNNFYAYTCIQYHNGSIEKYSLETFNFSAAKNANPVLGPTYEYEQPAPAMPATTWPFLCHSNGAIKWDASKTDAPRLVDGEPEVNGVTQFSRLNQFNTKIQFWNISDKDFKVTAEALMINDSDNPDERLQYDIERRVHNHFINNKKNNEWVNQKIFTEFNYALVPNPALDPFVPGQYAIQIRAEAGQVYMEPQPIDANVAPRFTYRCPTKDMLNSTDEGRMASIKHVLSSDSDRLQFETKPFFAACARGINYLSKDGKATLKSDRKIIFISKDDIIAMLSNRVAANKIKAEQASKIEEYLFAGAKNSADQYSFSFKMDELYSLRNLPIKSGQAFADTSTFTIVSPAVVKSNEAAINKSCSKPSFPIEDINYGYVFGCYPVELP